MITPPQWFPRRGEVCIANLDKRRPVIIISADFLNRRALDVTVIPISSIERVRFTCRVPIPAGVAGLRRDSFAKCDGVVTIDKRTILFPPLGALPPQLMTQVEDVLQVALALK